MLASVVFVLFAVMIDLHHNTVAVSENLFPNFNPVGFTSADYGWKSGTQYTYSVRGRTVTGLNQLANQFTGVLMRAVLNIQVKSDSTLSLQIKEPEYAEIHANLSNGWDTYIPDEFLHYIKLPLLNEPFELYLDDGIIKEMIVDKCVPTWQVNILKSIVSLLQIDLQGENIKESTMNLLPSNMSSGVFTTMEDSINGVYETIYDISELREHILQSKPELVPLPHLKGDGKILEIIKSKNFSNGDQHIVHHYGLDGQTNWEPGSNQMGNFLTRTSVSHIIISGNLKRYTIQYSVTTDKIIIAPHLYNKQKGIVASSMNLTIESVKSIEQPIAVVSNPYPIRNLVYEYNPFDKKGEILRENTEENLSDNGTELGSSKKKPYHKFSDSSSSSSSSESEYVHEHEPYYLPNFKLSESPYNNFVPLYVNEKSEMFHEQKFNNSQNVIKLAREISQGINSPNTLTGERTLQKFTTLIHIIRTMSAKELKEISDTLYYPYAKAKRGNSVNNALNYQTWVSLRDAVGQAGTGPALITIRDWIISQKIKGEEASQLIASLSYTAKHPTIEYLQYFFEMLEEKIFQKQSTLRASAVLSFTDLVRKAVVDRRYTHNYYPVHIFGILTKKSEKIVSDKFIPYFQKQLQKAVGDNNPVNIQLNIHALNSIAHPSVLLVLKPYLEGKKQISKFQRLTIVTSMDKIAKLYPDLAQTMLFRIYQNMADIPEIRVAAVMQLMKTDPPAQMLQQMAEQTNIDKTKQVNAAVKSAIESVASQEKNEYNWKMVEKARAAVNFLTSENYGVHYSRNFIKSYIIKGQNLAYKNHFAYIQSLDSIFPSSLFYNLKYSIGGYKYNNNEMQFMTSSMNKLFRRFGEILGLGKTNLSEDKKRRSNSTWSLVNIYNIINLKKEEEEEQLEGNFLATVFGVKRYNAFDNYTIENMHNFINEVGSSLMMNNNRFNYTKFYSQHSMEIAFPLSMGFPFIYTLETPTLLNIGLQMRGSMQPLKYNPDLANTNFLKINGKYYFGYSTHMEGKLGFITPYNDKIYLAGLEKSIHVNIPLHSKVDLNLKDSKIDTFFQPFETNNEQKLFEYSTGAFTSFKKVHDTSPMAIAKNTVVIQDKPLKFVHKSIGQEKIGFCFDIKLATDKNNIHEKLKDHDLLSLALFADTLDEISNQNFTIVYNPQSSWAKNVKLSLTYDKTGNINTKSASERIDVKENKDENEEKENFSVTRFENKKQELVKNVAMGIKDAETHFIKLQLAFEGLYKTEYELYFAYADSYVSNVSSILALARNSTTSSLNPKEYSIALQMTSMMPNVSLMSYKNILSGMPGSKIKGRVDFGEQIPYKSHLIMQGELDTSKERRHYLDQHPLTILCEKQIKKGYKLQPACRNITRRSLYHDNYHFNITYQNIPNEFKNMAHSFYRYINALWYEYNSEDTESKKFTTNIDVNIKFGKHLLSSNLSIAASDFSDRFENVPIHEWIRPLIVTHPKYNMIERLGHKILAAQESPLCTFDKDVITTFDNSSYFVNMGKTAHILAHNIPENYIFQTNDNSEYFSIIASQPSSESLELTIVVGDDVLEIKQNGVDVPILLVYNGKQIAVSDSLIQLKDSHENLVFKLLVLSEDAVKIMAEKNRFEVLYHKNHATIEVSNQFRSKLRGLCGNFDGESYNDFITPENCIMVDTERFIASYDLSGSSKRLATKENDETSNRVCYQQTYLFGNVVNEEEVKQFLDRKKKINYEEKMKKRFLKDISVVSKTFNA